MVKILPGPCNPLGTSVPVTGRDGGVQLRFYADHVNSICQRNPAWESSNALSRGLEQPPRVSLTS